MEKNKVLAGLSLAMSGLLMLSGCASIDKLDQVESGMTQSELHQQLGSPERVVSSTQREQQYYRLRESPHWWAVTGCVALPAVVPIFGVMWMSDGCLGESKSIAITLEDNIVTTTKIIE